MMTAEVVPGPSTALEVSRAMCQQEEQEDDEAVPYKKPKQDVPETSTSKTPEEIHKYLNDNFSVRRSFITVEMPPIKQVRDIYPELFSGKEMLAEFQRVTKFDIDHLIQEYCVKYATGLIDLAKGVPGASHILRQAEAVKQENMALKQYWDMVTSLCLIPLLMRENLVEMVREIGEDEQVDPKGNIVPILVSKGNIFNSDEFILVAEEEVLQEFEEFTMAFATLFAAYWVFNMQYPKTLNNSYNFIQKIIVVLRDGTPIPPPCKQLVQRLQKWEKSTSHRTKVK